MAETNLGQVVGIWLEDSEPPHKNVLWIKTINLLTSEKTGFIWNGVEWINIQGLGFSWKGEFDENTDYTKNDVVRFEDILYIKLNDIVNNGDGPDVSADFDLFLPAATPSGVEGSVQTKDANGKFFGSNLLTWLNQILTIVGNVIIKGKSATVGNALEVRNSLNDLLFKVGNNKSVRFYTDSIHLSPTTPSYSISVGGTVTYGGNTAIGLGSHASNASVSFGRQASSTGSRSVAIGNFVTATREYSAVFGAPDEGTVARITDVYFGSGYQMLPNSIGASGTTPVRYRGTDAASTTNNAGGSVSQISGKGQGTGLSGKVVFGYKQQNENDVEVLSIQEKIANSTDGTARILFTIKEVYADNAAAVTAGLPVNTLYRTSTGEIRLVV